LHSAAIILIEVTVSVGRSLELERLPMLLPVLPVPVVPVPVVPVPVVPVPVVPVPVVPVPVVPVPVVPVPVVPVPVPDVPVVVEPELELAMRPTISTWWLTCCDRLTDELSARSRYSSAFIPLIPPLRPVLPEVVVPVPEVPVPVVPVPVVPVPVVPVLVEPVVPEVLPVALLLPEPPLLILASVSMYCAPLAPALPAVPVAPAPVVPLVLLPAPVDALPLAGFRQP